MNITLFLVFLFFLLTLFIITNKKHYFTKYKIKRDFNRLIKNKDTLDNLNRIIQSSLSTHDYIAEIHEIDPDFLLLKNLKLITNIDDISKYFYAYYMFKILKLKKYMILDSPDNGLSLYKDKENNYDRNGLLKHDDNVKYEIEQIIKNLDINSLNL